MQSDPRHVTAICAAIDLTYLPQTLAALAEQQRRPDETVIVDVSAGGLDLSELIEAQRVAGLSVRRLHAPDAANFGDAVRAALHDAETPGPHDWLWLLHDDSPPEPAALAELLRATANTATVAVAGCKHVRVGEPDRLVSVGERMTAGGRRLSGIDAGEIDQGQYDGLDDVYAVDTAGMLITAEMWHRLGGPDPMLGPYGDGTDLSRRARLAGARVIIVPTAVVRHHRADLRDLRSDPPDPRRSVRRRREATLHARLTDSSPPGMVGWWVLMLLLAPVRALARVAASELSLAGGELAAAATVALRPRAVWRARRRATATRVVPRRRLRPLYAPRRDVLRSYRDRILTRMTERRRAKAPSELEIRERAALARRRRAVGAAVGLATLAVSVLVVTRTGSTLGGGIDGGAFAGTSGSARDLLQAAFSPWLATGDGHPGPPDPFWAVLALLAVLTGGPLGVSTATGLGLFVAASVPLAALAAWFAAGAATRSLAVRAWAAIVWALGPPAIIALAGADLAALVCHVCLPLLALALARAFGYDRQDVIASGLVGAGSLDEAADDDEAERARATRPAIGARVSGTGSIGAAAGAGLLLAICAAAAPFMLPVGIIALIAMAVVVRRRRARLLLVALPPLVLFAPILVSGPGLWRYFVTTPGTAPAIPGTVPAPDWAILLGWPGVVSGEPWILLAASAAGGSVLLAALIGLVRPAAAAAVRIGWLLAAAGLAMAMIVPAVGLGGIGPATSVLTAGLLIAGTTGLHGLTGGLRGYSFGWRQGLAALTGLVLALGGLGALATGWHAAADADRYAWSSGPTERIPALALQLTQGPDRSRVLALTADDEGVGAELWRGDGPQVTDSAIVLRLRGHAGDDEAANDLRALVAELSVGAAGDAAARLHAHAVSVVLVPPASGEAREDLLAALDSVAGLERVTENETGVFWRVGGADPAARVVVETAEGGRIAVPSAATTAGDRIDAGREATLVLAERADPGWQAWLDGRRLRSVPHDWQQAFEIPGDGSGQLTLRYEPAGTRAWHIGLLVVFSLTALLALPTRRRRREADR